MRIVAVYLAEASPPAAASYIAAAETLRAALFAAGLVLYSPWLAPLAAVLARTTSRATDPSSPIIAMPGVLEPLREVEPFGESDPDEPFLREIRQYGGSPDPYALQLIASADFAVDAFVALSAPQPGPAQVLAQRARAVYGFRRLQGDALAEHLTQATLLDADWTPPAGWDPETGYAEDADRTLPPFGLLLQSALAGPEEPIGERPR